MKRWKVTVMVFPPKPEEQNDASIMQAKMLRGEGSPEDKFPDGKPKEITFDEVEGDAITDAMEGGWNLARMDYPGSKVLCLKAIRR